MAHAAKNVTSIPIHFAVNIYAAEGLLHVAEKQLAIVVKAVLEGDETASALLTSRREAVVNYNRQYTQAIKALEFYMQKA